MNPFLLILILGGGLIGLAYCLRGSVSLRARDKFASKDFSGDAYYGQTMSTMHNDQHGGF
ncbi:hypothetical protein [Brevibacillus migulae]|uniref:hypothetical protein n=1 Tax=Brevibacillus migulae TaxID=1644114 RepID=UPI00106DEF0D|nr:hypothetical protein [Brevibacillus migulae]